jgi:hypothetical protein
MASNQRAQARTDAKRVQGKLDKNPKVFPKGGQTPGGRSQLSRQFCYYCPKSFERFSELVGHLSCAHLDKIKDHLTRSWSGGCPLIFCRQTTFSPIDLEEHLRGHKDQVVMIAFLENISEVPKPLDQRRSPPLRFQYGLDHYFW